MSLRRFMLSLTALIILVVLLIFGTGLTLLQQDISDLQAQEEAALVSLNVGFLHQRILVYRDIVRGLARDPVVRDLLLFADPEKAMAWSDHVRKILPHAVGAALIAPDGVIVGDPLAQRVGPTCQRDIRRLFSGEPLSPLPVHDAISELAHFDFTEAVHDEAGTRLGTLMVSFSLAVLADGLEHLATGDRALRLLTGDDGRVFLASRNWDEMTGQHALRMPLPDTGWTLEMKLREPVSLPSFGEVSAVLMVGMALLIVLMLLFSRELGRRYLTEVENLRDILRAISSGEGGKLQQLTGGRGLFPLGSSLAEELSQLDEDRRRLHLTSQTDPLTGLANRRALDDRLASLMGGQGRVRTGFCLVLFDLDDFKPINDSHGHAVGDEVLKALAQALRSQVRPTDLASRWGGDEFAVLLPQMGKDQVTRWLARVQTLFAQAQQDITGLTDAACTVSVGFVCATRGDRTSVAALQRKADEHLYQAKAERQAKTRA